MTICQYLTNWQLNKTCKLSILYMYRKEVLIMETDYYRQFTFKMMDQFLDRFEHDTKK